MHLRDQGKGIQEWKVDSIENPQKSVEYVYPKKSLSERSGLGDRDDHFDKIRLLNTNTKFDLVYTAIHRNLTSGQNPRRNLTWLINIR